MIASSTTGKRSQLIFIEFVFSFSRDRSSLSIQIDSIV